MDAIVHSATGCLCHLVRHRGFEAVSYLGYASGEMARAVIHERDHLVELAFRILLDLPEPVLLVVLDQGILAIQTDNSASYAVEAWPDLPERTIQQGFSKAQRRIACTDSNPASNASVSSRPRAEISFLNETTLYGSSHHASASPLVAELLCQTAQELGIVLGNVWCAVEDPMRRFFAERLQPSDVLRRPRSPVVHERSEVFFFRHPI